HRARRRGRPRDERGRHVVRRPLPAGGELAGPGGAATRGRLPRRLPPGQGAGVGMIAVGTNATIAPPVEAVIRGAQRAESRGYDSLWWPDHLMGFHPQQLWRPEVTALAQAVPNPHIFVDPVAAISACAVHTERIRLGTSVTDAIRRHPAMLAQEFLTLDHFSKGRTILGIGAGEGENIT